MDPRAKIRPKLPPFGSSARIGSALCQMAAAPSKVMDEQRPPGPGPRAVPVVPNSARVRARLLGVRDDPAGGSLVSLEVRSADDVPGVANFIKSRVGQVIEAKIPAGITTSGAESDEVQVEIAYRGDEGGGRFVVVGDGMEKLGP